VVEVAEQPPGQGVAPPSAPVALAAGLDPLVSRLADLLPGAVVEGLFSVAGLSPASAAAAHAAASIVELARVKRVELVPGQDVASVVRGLNRRNWVLRAYLAPRPVPAARRGSGVRTATAGRQAQGASPRLEPAQAHLASPPFGLGVVEAWRDFGATGQGVTVCDIEGRWTLDHEDLPTTVTHIGGQLYDGRTPAETREWEDHGTAVLGLLLGLPDGKGVCGIAPQARGAVYSAYTGTYWNAAGAIVEASQKLSPGDVILLELNAEEHEGGPLMPMTYWSYVRLAVRAATDRGICVVAAAGNGGQDLDATAYAKSGVTEDCGAILVGAGVPGLNFRNSGQGTSVASYDSLGRPLTRMEFSNYGSPVHVQAWGGSVTTAGYGDAPGGKGPRATYTYEFSGTSSASALVAGVVALIQSYQKRRKQPPLKPGEVRELLVKTGIPQEPGTAGTVADRIGPMPSLPAALREL